MRSFDITHIESPAPSPLTVPLRLQTKLCNEIMDFNDFPNYFQAASKSSAKYQQYYKSIKRTAVILLILAVVITMYSFQRPEYSFWVYGVIAIFLLSSFVLSVVLLTKKYDQIWQKSFSLKASCKAITWQFIMGVGEFSSHEDASELQSAFENRIQQIVKEFEEITVFLDAAVLSRDILTAKMFELKQASFNYKKTYYAEHRIHSLHDRYFKKAVEHHQKYKLWSLNLIMAQLLALGAIVYLMMGISVDWSIIALVTTLVSSVVSWLELQQNLEKKQHYTLALKKLEVIEKGMDHITLESELSAFVLDVEKIISGPNALWLTPEPVMSEHEVLV